jgi:CDP-paratose 2-epimerase
MNATVLNGTARAPRSAVLITGGAGFIGANLAHRLLERGCQVRVFDSFARAGVEDNVRWLRDTHGERIEILQGDVRDVPAVQAAVSGVDHVFHLAAQVAVTSSLVDPRHDFEVNALGTLNVLEAMRRCECRPSIVFSSTNKVYGALDDIDVGVIGQRYEPSDRKICERGIGEWRTLEFHSPYGCSKGAAEQYVLDYARSYGIRSVVLRMSCIYGPHQHGNEDQGWVAHFLRSALAGQPITIYGDGCQVRDVLFVEDLLDAFEAAYAGIGTLSGRAFNIGGGPANAVSLREVLSTIEQTLERPIELEFADWRTGDQRYYVSDVRRFQEATRWRPQTDVRGGIEALATWLDGAMPEVPVSGIRNRPPTSLTTGARP